MELFGWANKCNFKQVSIHQAAFEACTPQWVSSRLQFKGVGLDMTWQTSWNYIHWLLASHCLSGDPQSDADVAEMNWSDRCPVVWIWTPCRPGVWTHTCPGIHLRNRLSLHFRVDYSAWLKPGLLGQAAGELVRRISPSSPTTSMLPAPWNAVCLQAGGDTKQGGEQDEISLTLHTAEYTEQGGWISMQK